MKRIGQWMMAAILTCGLGMFWSCADTIDNPVTPDNPGGGTTETYQGLSTPVSQMERLSRGLVVVPLGDGQTGNFVSWRLLGYDPASTTFDLLRNGETIASDLKVSNFIDASGAAADSYQVVTKVGGLATDTTEPATSWGQPYMTLALDRPATGELGGEYTPNDCSVGDVDGDGEYEIIVKWDPSNQKDNSQNDKTDKVYLDCYKIVNSKSSNSKLLWRIDLGVNIRAGAHYTQFMVSDFDGDGRAELICKTAPGSKDGQGRYVNQAATDEQIKAADNEKDWRTSKGRVNGGHEYLTVFNGLTGAAVHTIAYLPNRNALAELSEAAGTFNWDDRSGKNDKGDYGNRGERYLAAVAWLGGPDANPSGIFCRGYYTYAYVWAVDFDGQRLKHRWLHRSDSKTAYSVVGSDMVESAKISAPPATSGSGSQTMYGNGNHNLSIGDVDGDGRDEIIWGSAALDDNGHLLYATGFGHGDAMHLSAMDPDRGGMQVFQVHEEKGTYSWDLHDAATGEVIFKGGNSGKDNGRGLAADVIPESRGFEFWSSDERQQRSVQTGDIVGQKSTSVNFRMYWNGTPYDQTLDGSTLDYWDGSSYTRLMTFSAYGNSATCNSTKKTPCLLADLFGDWREELVLWDSSNSSTLNIFTTNIPTDYRVPTLMHDHTYRLGVAWQNTAYNQPPHLGYYLPDYVK